tara:strand:+ start:590 stop:1198 length:609 start_codon:yes stop_codon:yes gene_type:complete
MKTYPTISYRKTAGHVFVFDKLDGSNIRAEWNKNKGFFKFGRRNGLLDHSNPVLLEAPDIIMAKYADDMSQIFKKMRVRKATAFFEFWGPNSSFGAHADEPHDCTLIDVHVHPKGILEPREFLKHFGYLDHAALLREGPWTDELDQQVRNGTFPGMTFEGVVCKGKCVSPGKPLMFKVKNIAWLQKLRSHCGDDDKLFEKMK